MEKFDPVDIDFIINSEEVTKKSASIKKDITGVAQSAEENLSKANKRIADTFRNTNAQLRSQQIELQNNKRKWNGLGNSINQLSREMPAFAVSAQTGFLAISNNLPILSDEISKLRKENDALRASGEKTTPVWKQLVKGLFSWQTLLSVGISLLTVYGKELVDYTKKLFQGAKGLSELKRSKQALDEAFKSSQFSKVIEELLTVRSYLQSAKKGFLDKEVAVKKYNETLGETIGKVNTIAEAEKNLNNKAGAYVQAMLYKTAATLSLKESAQKLVENAKSQFENQSEIDAIKNNENSTAHGKTDEEILALRANKRTGRSTKLGLSQVAVKIREQQKLVREAQKETEEAMSLADSFNSKVEELSKKFDLNLFGEKDKKTGAKETNKYKNLLQKIADLDKEFAQKRLSSNEAEIQALRDKFAKMRALIQAFNSDPKNKGKIIDANQLDPIETQAIQDVTFRQETALLKEELETKKVIFAEFEEYKKQFGIQKAKEKFQEEIGEFDTYLQYVNEKVQQNQATINAVGSGVATGGQKERASLVLGAQDNAQQEQDQQFEKLLAQLQSYEQRRLQIIEEYQLQRQQLLQAGFFSEASELDSQHQENLNKLDEAYAKGTPQYQALINGVENLSRKAAKSVIADARQMVEALVASGKLSEKAAADISKKIDGLEKEIQNKTAATADLIAQKAFQISAAFSGLSDSVRPFNEDLADSLETVSDLSAIAGDAATSVAGFASGDFVSGITGAISALSGILNIAAKSRESERKAREEIRKYHEEIFVAQLAYNNELRKRVVEEVKLNDLYKSRVDNIKEEINANRQNSETIIKDQERVFKKLFHAQTIVGKKTKKSGGFLGIGRKTKVVDINNSVAEVLGAGRYVDRNAEKNAALRERIVKLQQNNANAKSISNLRRHIREDIVFEPKEIELTNEVFDRLEKLNGENPLTGDAKTAFDQLKKLRDEYGSIEEAQRQLQIELKNTVTGTTAQSIGDSIKEATLEGRDSFASVAKDIEGFLRDAIIAGMNTKIIEPEMQKLQDKLYDFLGDGVLTENEKDDFQQMYAEVSSAASEYLDLINQSGVDLFEENASALSGGIGRQITEETGSEITGLMRGQFDITKQHYDLAVVDHDLHQRVYDVNLQILEVNEQTARNTARTAEQMVVAVEELKSINNNTRQTQNSRDLGV